MVPRLQSFFGMLKISSMILAVSMTLREARWHGSAKVSEVHSSIVRSSKGQLRSAGVHGIDPILISLLYVLARVEHGFAVRSGTARSWVVVAATTTRIALCTGTPEAILLIGTL